MSTRYLKKVYGNNVVAVDDNAEEESDAETNDVQAGGGKQKCFNVFDLVLWLYTKEKCSFHVICTYH